MNYIEKLNHYHLEIKQKILNSNTIIQALANPSSTFYLEPLPIVDHLAENVTYEEDGIIFLENGQRKINKNNLLFHRIFPYRYIEKNTENTNTFLTFHFPSLEINRNVQSNQQNYKTNYITFNIYTHPILLPLENGELRTLFIASEIDKLFSGKQLCHSFGSASLQDWGNIDFLDGAWQGHTLTYQLIDTEYSSF